MLSVCAIRISPLIMFALVFFTLYQHISTSQEVMDAVVDELLMGDVDADAPIVPPQGNQDADVPAGDAIQATQRITDAQKIAVHAHFLDESAERWNNREKKKGLEAMISAAAVLAGLIYATLKLSQLKTQHANYRAVIIVEKDDEK